MNRFKKAIVALVVALPIVTGSLVVATPQASAATGVDMNLVCQYTMRNDVYLAKVVNQTASGWRCYDRRIVNNPPLYNADIWGYCVNVLGYNGAYNTTNNVYGWYCA